MKYTGICFYQYGVEWHESPVTVAELNGPNLLIEYRDTDPEGSVCTVRAFADDAIHFHGQYRYAIRHGDIVLKAYTAPDGEVVLFGTWTNTSDDGGGGRWGFKLTPAGP